MENSNWYEPEKWYDCSAAGDCVNCYNNSDNINNLGIGHLWIPYAEEVFDRFITVTMSIGNFNQYNSLKSINSRTKKIITDEIGRNNSWWTASASNGSSTSYVTSTYGGVKYVKAKVPLKASSCSNSCCASSCSL